MAAGESLISISFVASDDARLFEPDDLFQRQVWSVLFCFTQMAGAHSVNLRFDDFARIGLRVPGFLEGTEQIGPDSVNAELDRLLHGIASETEAVDVSYLLRPHAVDAGIDQVSKSDIL